MSWLDKVRQKPREEKIRIIRITVVIAVILMAVAWMFSAQYSKNTPKDTTLFKAIGQGIKDIRDNYKK